MAPTSGSGARNTLLVCCGAHLVQDGLVALQYVLLPILAQSYGLSYAQVGLLRAVSNTAMSVLELPAGLLAERRGEALLLVVGLLGAALGYMGVASASGFTMLVAAFLLAGAGAALQHSLASTLIARTFAAAARRRALGAYNASGDAGKLAFTSAFGLGVGVGLAWSAVVMALAGMTAGFALLAWRLLAAGPAASRRTPVGGVAGHGPDRGPPQAAVTVSPRGAAQPTTSAGRWGIRAPRRFFALGTMVFLDSAVQAAFLTFIAFVLLEKGAGESAAAAGVVLVLVGGMVGKYCAGLLAARFGDRGSFVLLQVLTMAGVGAVIALPALALLALLPLIGLVLQGSSTVTYGCVPDFVEEHRQSRGYALIYTLASASAVVGPLALGLLADRAGLSSAMVVLCGLALATVPFAGVLSAQRADAVALAT